MGERLQRKLQRVACDELLNGEIFYSLAEAKVLIEAWRRHYNTIRPHSSLGYRPPAPETASPPLPPSGSASLHLRSEEHTSELQSLMRISYAVFCLKKKKQAS